MKILALSDTHNFGYPLEALPDADILIHAGDACMNGSKSELINFSYWLNSVAHKYKHVVFVPGNHDQQFNGPGFNQEALQLLKPATVLINEYLWIDGLCIFGSPVTKPAGHPWYYFWNDPQRCEFWIEQLEQPRPNVLVTHGPPHHVGDQLHRNQQHIGCKHLRKYVEEAEPALHIFGHIHEGHGVYEGRDITWYPKGRVCNTVFINASIRDHNYSRAHAPFLISMDKVEGQWAVVATEELDHWQHIVKRERG